ncbi:Uncharacterised protein [Mycobacteroides abscessus]|nr:Uncharacterised protein [Mycobacteroides abscessus]
MMSPTPSVAMNALTRSFAMTSPLTRPTTAATPTAASTPSQTRDGSPAMVVAPTIELSATT